MNKSLYTVSLGLWLAVTAQGADNMNQATSPVLELQTHPVVIQTITSSAPAWKTTVMAPLSSATLETREWALGDRSLWYKLTPNQGLLWVLMDNAILSGYVYNPALVFNWDASLNDGTVPVIMQGNPFLTNLTYNNKGSSVYFDGVDDWLIIHDNQHGAEYTISFWVNFQQVRNGSLIGLTTTSFTSARSHQIYVENGKLVHYTFAGGANYVYGTTTLQTNQWYHVAVTALTGDGIRLYLNGREDGFNTSCPSIWTGGLQWHIANPNVGSFFHGYLDQLRLLKYAATPAEISMLMTNENININPGSLSRVISSTNDLRWHITTNNQPVWVQVQPHQNFVEDRPISFILMPITNDSFASAGQLAWEPALWPIRWRNLETNLLYYKANAVLHNYGSTRVSGEPYPHTIWTRIEPPVNSLVNLDITSSRSMYYMLGQGTETSLSGSIASGTQRKYTQYVIKNNPYYLYLCGDPDTYAFFNVNAVSYTNLPNETRETSWPVYFPLKTATVTASNDADLVTVELPVYQAEFLANALGALREQNDSASYGGTIWLKPEFPVNNGRWHLIMESMESTRILNVTLFRNITQVESTVNIYNKSWVVDEIPYFCKLAGNTPTETNPVFYVNWQWHEQPVNDQFANPTILTLNPITNYFIFQGQSFHKRRSRVSTLARLPGASSESNEYLYTFSPENRTVWYQWTATNNRPATVYARATNNIYVRVVTGSAINGLSSVVDVYSSNINRSFTPTPGTVYRITVQSVHPEPVLLTLEQTMAPDNDAFSLATPLAQTNSNEHVYHAAGNLYNLTNEGGEPDATPSAWFRWTPPVQGTAVIQAMTDKPLNNAAVYTGTLGNFTLITSLQISGNNIYSASFACASNVTYYIRLTSSQDVPVILTGTLHVSSQYTADHYSNTIQMPDYTTSNYRLSLSPDWTNSQPETDLPSWQENQAAANNEANALYDTNNPVTVWTSLQTTQPAWWFMQTENLWASFSLKVKDGISPLFNRANPAQPLPESTALRFDASGTWLTNDARLSLSQTYTSSIFRAEFYYTYTTPIGTYNRILNSFDSSYCPLVVRNSDRMLGILNSSSFYPFNYVIPTNTETYLTLIGNGSQITLLVNNAVVSTQSTGYDPNYYRLNSLGPWGGRLRDLRIYNRQQPARIGIELWKDNQILAIDDDDLSCSLTNGLYQVRWSALSTNAGGVLLSKVAVTPEHNLPQIPATLFITNKSDCSSADKIQLTLNAAYGTSLGGVEANPYGYSQGTYWYKFQASTNQTCMVERLEGVDAAFYVCHTNTGTSPDIGYNLNTLSVVIPENKEYYLHVRPRTDGYLRFAVFLKPASWNDDFSKAAPVAFLRSTQEMTISNLTVLLAWDQAMIQDNNESASFESSEYSLFSQTGIASANKTLHWRFTNTQPARLTIDFSGTAFPVLTGLRPGNYSVGNSFTVFRQNGIYDHLIASNSWYLTMDSIAGTNGCFNGIITAYYCPTNDGYSTPATSVWQTITNISPWPDLPGSYTWLQSRDPYQNFSASSEGGETSMNLSGITPANRSVWVRPWLPSPGRWDASVYPEDRFLIGYKPDSWSVGNNFQSTAMKHANVPFSSAQFIRVGVDGCFTNSGVFLLDQRFYPAPTNDFFAQAAHILWTTNRSTTLYAAGSLTQTWYATSFLANNRGATTEGSEYLLSLMTGIPVTGNTLWYQFIPPASGLLRIQTRGDGFITAIGLKTGGVGNTPQVASSSGTISNYAVAAGTTYYLQIDSLTQAGFIRVDMDLQIVPNDAFANAQTINLTAQSSVEAWQGYYFTNQTFQGSAVGNNTYATQDGVSFSTSAGWPQANRSIWFKFLPPVKSEARISLQGSEANHLLGAGVYSSVGTSPQYSDRNMPPQLTYPVTENQWQTIQIDGAAVNGLGIAQVWVQVPQPPVNDNYSQARVLSSASFQTEIESNQVTQLLITPGTTVNATTEGENFSSYSFRASNRRTVWYQFTPTVSGPLHIQVEGRDPHAVCVYSSFNSGYLGGVLPNEQGIANLMLTVSAGTTYRICVSAHETASPFLLKLRQWAAPPSNDNYANRITITNAITGTLGGATRESGESTGHGSGPSVWYRFVAPVNGRAEISTHGSLADTHVGVYSGFTTLVAANNDADGLATSRVQWNISAGQEYNIAVAWNNQSTHCNFTLQLQWWESNQVIAYPAAGSYEDQVIVTLGNANNSPMYYSINNGSFLLYTGPITISEGNIDGTAQLTAYIQNGPTNTWNYTIKSPTPIVLPGTPVIWEDAPYFNNTGTSLKKINRNGEWNGTVSETWLAGDFVLSMGVSPGTSNHWLMGVVATNRYLINLSSILYGMENNRGTLRIYESGNIRVQTPLPAAACLQIERRRSRVFYYVNGKILYTSTLPTTQTLKPAAALCFLQEESPPTTVMRTGHPTTLALYRADSSAVRYTMGIPPELPAPVQNTSPLYSPDAQYGFWYNFRHFLPHHAGSDHFLCILPDWITLLQFSLQPMENCQRTLTISNPSGNGGAWWVEMQNQTFVTNAGPQITLTLNQGGLISAWLFTYDGKVVRGITNVSMLLTGLNVQPPSGSIASLPFLVSVQHPCTSNIFYTDIPDRVPDIPCPATLLRTNDGTLYFMAIRPGFAPEFTSRTYVYAPNLEITPQGVFYEPTQFTLMGGPNTKYRIGGDGPWQTYTGPFILDGVPGGSNTLSAYYEIGTTLISNSIPVIFQCKPPSVQVQYYNDYAQITAMSDTPGAQLRYQTGNVYADEPGPQEPWQDYTQSLHETNSRVFQFKAEKPNYLESTVSRVVIRRPAPAPVFETPTFTTNQPASIKLTVPDQLTSTFILITPRTNVLMQTGTQAEFVVNQNGLYQAYVSRNGWSNSPVASQTYQFVATGWNLQAQPGTCFISNTVIKLQDTINNPQPLVVRYTLDGSAPSQTSPLLPVNLVITQSCVLRVQATREGYQATEQTLVLTHIPPVSLNPPPGVLNEPTQITLSYSTNLYSVLWRIQTNAWQPPDVPIILDGGIGNQASLEFQIIPQTGCSNLEQIVIYQFKMNPPQVWPLNTNISSPVEITASTAHGAVYYAEGPASGEAPGTPQTLFVSPLICTQTRQYAFVARKPGYADSDVVYRIYSSPMPAPIWKNSQTTYTNPVSITVALPVPGWQTVVVGYPNGSATTNTAQNQITVNANAGGVYTVQTFKSPWLPSAVATQELAFLVTDLQISPTNTRFSSNLVVTLGSQHQPPLTFYYTLDGTTPNTNSLLYTAPINLTDSVVLTILGVRPGYQSQIVTRQYVKVPDIIISPTGGTNYQPVQVTIQANASIFYNANQSGWTEYKTPILLDGGPNGTVNLSVYAETNGVQSNPVTETYVFQTAPPVFTPSGRPLTNTVTCQLHSDTTNALLYYAINYLGDMPAYQAVTQRYTQPLVITNTAVILAKAEKPGYQTSYNHVVYSAPLPLPVCLNTLFIHDQQVELRALSGLPNTGSQWQIQHPDGTITEHNINNPLLAFYINKTGPYTIINKKDNWLPSPPLTVYFTFKVADLYVTPPSGLYASNQLQVQAYSGYAGPLQIFYTLDGSEPTTNSSPYTGPFNINNSCVIRWLAMRTGYIPMQATNQYVLTPEIQMTPPGGLFSNAVQVTLTCALPLEYSMDGVNWMPYTQPILVDGFPGGSGYFNARYSHNGSNILKRELFTFKTAAPVLLPDTPVTSAPVVFYAMCPTENAIISFHTNSVAYGYALTNRWTTNLTVNTRTFLTCQASKTNYLTSDYVQRIVKGQLPSPTLIIPNTEWNAPVQVEVTMPFHTDAAPIIQGPYVSYLNNKTEFGQHRAFYTINGSGAYQVYAYGSFWDESPRWTTNLTFRVTSLQTTRSQSFNQGALEVYAWSTNNGVPLTIHYTLDGSEPTTSHPVYAGRLLITNTTTVRWLATRPGYQPQTHDNVYVKVDPVHASPPPGVYYNPITITLSPSNNLQYSINNGPYMEYTGPFNLSGINNGIVALKALYNNAENEFTYYFDTHPPLVEPAHIETTSNAVVIVTPNHPDDVIYYWDGDDLGNPPATNKPPGVYTGPLTFNVSKQILFWARRPGHRASSFVSSRIQAQLPGVQLPATNGPFYQPFSLPVQIPINMPVTLFVKTPGNQYQYPNVRQSVLIPVNASGSYQFWITASNWMNSATNTWFATFQVNDLWVKPEQELQGNTNIIIEAGGSPQHPQPLTVFYTLDQSIPTLSSPRYTTPLILEDSYIHIRFMGYRDGYEPQYVDKYYSRIPNAQLTPLQDYYFNETSFQFIVPANGILHSRRNQEPWQTNQSTFNLNGTTVLEYYVKYPNECSPTNQQLLRFKVAPVEVTPNPALVTSSLDITARTATTNAFIYYGHGDNDGSVNYNVYSTSNIQETGVHFIYNQNNRFHVYKTPYLYTNAIVHPNRTRSYWFAARKPGYLDSDVQLAYYVGKMPAPQSAKGNYLAIRSRETNIITSTLEAVWYKDDRIFSYYTSTSIVDVYTNSGIYKYQTFRSARGTNTYVPSDPLYVHVTLESADSKTNAIPMNMIDPGTHYVNGRKVQVFLSAGTLSNASMEPFESNSYVDQTGRVWLHDGRSTWHFWKCPLDGWFRVRTTSNSFVVVGHDNPAWTPINTGQDILVQGFQNREYWLGVYGMNNVQDYNVVIEYTPLPSNMHSNTAIPLQPNIKAYNHGAGVTWYDYQATYNGMLYINVSEGTLVLFKDQQPVEPLDIGNNGKNYAFRLTPGSYKLMHTNEWGDYQMQISNPFPPPNDYPYNAIPLNMTMFSSQIPQVNQYYIEGTTVGATLDAGEPNPNIHSVWYIWKAPRNGVFQIFLESRAQQVVRMYTGAYYDGFQEITNLIVDPVLITNIIQSSLDNLQLPQNTWNIRIESGSVKAWNTLDTTLVCYHDTSGSPLVVSDANGNILPLQRGYNLLYAGQYSIQLPSYSYNLLQYPQYMAPVASNLFYYIQVSGPAASHNLKACFIGEPMHKNKEYAEKLYWNQHVLLNGSYCTLDIPVYFLTRDLDLYYRVRLPVAGTLRVADPGGFQVSINDTNAWKGNAGEECLIHIRRNQTGYGLVKMQLDTVPANDNINNAVTLFEPVVQTYLASEVARVMSDKRLYFIGATQEPFENEPFNTIWYVHRNNQRTYLYVTPAPEDLVKIYNGHPTNSTGYQVYREPGRCVLEPGTFYVQIISPKSISQTTFVLVQAPDNDDKEKAGSIRPRWNKYANFSYFIFSTNRHNHLATRQPTDPPGMEYTVWFSIQPPVQFRVLEGAYSQWQQDIYWNARVSEPHYVFYPNMPTYYQGRNERNPFLVTVGGPEGYFTLDVLGVTPPANDHRTNALPLKTDTFSTIHASREPKDPDSLPYTIWYDFSITMETNVQINIYPQQITDLLGVAHTNAQYEIIILKDNDIISRNAGRTPGCNLSNPIPGLYHVLIATDHPALGALSVNRQYRTVNNAFYLMTSMSVDNARIAVVRSPAYSYIRMPYPARLYIQPQPQDLLIETPGTPPRQVPYMPYMELTGTDMFSVPEPLDTLYILAVQAPTNVTRQSAQTKSIRDGTWNYIVSSTHMAVNHEVFYRLQATTTNNGTWNISSAGICNLYNEQGQLLVSGTNITWNASPVIWLGHAGQSRIDTIQVVYLVKPPNDDRENAAPVRLTRSVCDNGVLYTASYLVNFDGATLQPGETSYNGNHTVWSMLEIPHNSVLSDYNRSTSIYRQQNNQLELLYAAGENKRNIYLNKGDVVYLQDAEHSNIGRGGSSRHLVLADIPFNDDLGNALVFPTAYMVESNQQHMVFRTILPLPYVGLINLPVSSAQLNIQLYHPIITNSVFNLLFGKPNDIQLEHYLALTRSITRMPDIQSESCYFKAIPYWADPTNPLIYNITLKTNAALTGFNLYDGSYYDLLYPQKTVNYLVHTYNATLETWESSENMGSVWIKVPCLPPGTHKEILVQATNRLNTNMCVLKVYQGNPPVLTTTGNGQIRQVITNDTYIGIMRDSQGSLYDIRVSVNPWIHPETKLKHVLPLLSDRLEPDYGTEKNRATIIPLVYDNGVINRILVNPTPDTITTFTAPYSGLLFKATTEPALDLYRVHEKEILVNPPPGTYARNFHIQVHPVNRNIRYTLDGTDPCNGNPYLEPLLVTNDIHLRMCLDHGEYKEYFSGHYQIKTNTIVDVSSYNYISTNDVQFRIETSNVWYRINNGYWFEVKTNMLVITNLPSGMGYVEFGIPKDNVMVLQARYPVMLTSPMPQIQPLHVVQSQSLQLTNQSSEVLYYYNVTTRQKNTLQPQETLTLPSNYKHEVYFWHQLPGRMSSPYVLGIYDLR